MNIDLSNKSPVTPIASASIILVRETLSGIELLMAERHADLSFAAGALVFPGGRIDQADYESAKLLGSSADIDAVSKIAALRELKEETSLSVTPDGQGHVHLFAHWITPKESPKRFDTRFYIAPFFGKAELVVDGSEIVRAEWLKPDDILSGETSGAYGLMFPTRLIVREIAQFNKLKPLLTHAANREVIAVTPRVEMRKNEMWITIPSNAGYDITEVRRDQIFEFMGPKRL